MDFILVLFLFLLPLAALIMSIYSLFYVRTLKKVVADKAAAMRRLAGSDVAYE